MFGLHYMTVVKVRCIFLIPHQALEDISCLFLGILSPLSLSVFPLPHFNPFKILLSFFDIFR